jgi:F0F1-type ATP synthase delta subunit
MNVKDDVQIVEIWLSNAEKNDKQIRDSLQVVFDKYRKKKYMVAVFESGSKDLYQGTLDLLAYNRKLSAQKQVQRDKHRAMEH